ncbi:hypothetical protein [Halosimplex sp. TS25]|uniref:hypothetical protein n=1 Tax=Halosimplex rarum TaxID=3396619 RepID=UPI0039EC5460
MEALFDVEAGDDGTASQDTNVGYSLRGTDAAAFSIDGNTGDLSLDAPQDFEVRTQDEFPERPVSRFY